MSNTATRHFSLGKRPLAEFAGQNSAGKPLAPKGNCKKNKNKNYDPNCLPPTDCPSSHPAPAHTNHSHSSHQSSSTAVHSHSVIVTSPKTYSASSSSLNHSAPVFTPSTHPVTASRTQVTSSIPQKSSKQGHVHSITESPVHNTHSVETVQSSLPSSLTHLSSSTHSTPTSTIHTHPSSIPSSTPQHHSSTSTFTHHPYSVVSSPPDHLNSIVMSSKSPVVSLPEAIDVFKTGSIYSNNDTLIVAGALDGVCVNIRPALIIPELF